MAGLKKNKEGGREGAVRKKFLMAGRKKNRGWGGC